MPGGAKKAVFPTMAMHDHEHVRDVASEQQGRARKLQHAMRGKSTEGKESPEKEKEPSNKTKNKNPPPKTETPATSTSTSK